jgi:WD40 repeat protein
LASGSADKTVILWNVKSFKKEGKLLGYDVVTSVAYSFDSKYLAAGSSDHTVYLWSLEQKKVLFTIYGHTAKINSVAFSPDGKYLASGSDDKTAQLWDIQ